MKKKETAAEKPEKTKKAAEKSEQETQNREKDEDKNKKQKEEYEIINNVKYPKNTNNEFVKQIKEHGKNENDNIELEKKNALNRYRLGEGISDNKNSVSSSVKGAASGAVFGSVSNGAIGKIERNIETKNISKILEKREDWGIAYRKASGNPGLAIETLLENKKGFVPDAAEKKGIGKIDFVWGNSNGGIKHIIERRTAQGYDGVEYVKKIPQMIKEGKVVENSKHPGRKYIVHDGTETTIRLDWNQKERKWLVTSYYQYD